jgi:hypothetical protein
MALVTTQDSLSPTLPSIHGSGRQLQLLTCSDIEVMPYCIEVLLICFKVSGSKIYISSYWLTLNHVEYPAVSVGHKLLSRNCRGHKSMRITASPWGSQSEPWRCLPAHFKLTKAGSQAAIVHRWQCSQWWLVSFPTSLLKITDCHRSTLHCTLCRQRHHTSSLSDVSWGKVRRLTEWRNTPGTRRPLHWPECRDEYT